MGLSRGVYRMQGTVVWDGTLRELEEKVESVTEMAGSRRWHQEVQGRALRRMWVTVSKMFQEGTQGQKSIHWVK